MYIYIICLYTYMGSIIKTSLYIFFTEMKPGPWKPGPLVITLKGDLTSNQEGIKNKPHDPGIQFHWKMNENKHIFGIKYLNHFKLLAK